MLILGLDTTAVSASAAIAEIKDGKLFTYAKFTAKNKMTHSENLLPMIDHLLSVYGAKIGDVELLAVNAGPGSFTGVRIGVSTVKGLAFPKDLPCAAVSTLGSIAKNVGGLAGRVCALMDARRGQFYYALFENGVRVTEDDIAGADVIAPMLSDGTLLVGDGAEVFLKAYTGDRKLILAPEECRDQSALSVCLCGEAIARAGNTVSGKDLRPVYLRLPQAERERLEKLSTEHKGD